MGARPTVWLSSDRDGFAPAWRRACERANLDVRTAPVPGLLERAAPGTAVVVDAGEAPAEEAGLLSLLGYARAAGASAAVDLGPFAPSAAALALLEDLCPGLVVRDAARVDDAVAQLARRLDARRAATFGHVARAPTGEGLVAVLADGRARLVRRPLSADDPGTPVRGVRLQDGGRVAAVSLAGGVVVHLRAAALASDEGGAPLGAERPGVGPRLRALRLAAGITQAELARRTGIHRPNIARVEAGRHTPSLDTLVRIARAIGVSPAEVLRGP